MSPFTEQADSLYGRLIAGVDVEEALQAHVELWLDLYLNEVERQHGRAVGSLERPRSYVVSGELERFPEDQLPAILVGSPGTADLPLADGQGRYTVRFGVTLAAHVAAARGALELARLYALALRALALQQPPDLYMRVDWVGESYDTLDSIANRTVCTAEVRLECQVPDVTNRYAGPPAAEQDGSPDSPTWPVAQTADTAVEKVPLEEEL